MLFQLQYHTTYTHSGNTSSRAFLLGENFSTGKNLIVCDTQKEAEYFAKILSFSTQSKVSLLENVSSVVDFTCQDIGWFVTTKDLFEANIRWKYHIQKHTLHVQRNDEIGPEKLVNALIDAGYSHSPHLSKPGSYKKEGDTLSIRTPFDEKIVALSFFDTVLDEILLFDLSGQFMTKKEGYSFAYLTDNQKLHERGSIDPETSEIFFFLQNTTTIFIDLDFYDPLERVSNLCQKPIIFSGNPKDNSINIWVSEPKIASLQELETLVKNFGKNVHFSTKHTKVLRNFLEYNNLTSLTLSEVNIPNLESFAIADNFFIRDDILGDIFIRNRTRKSISKNLDLLLEIRPGDYVVHRDHGVGIFSEIVEKSVGGNRREYMHIAYRENDVLFVPLTEI
ncbi:MAG: Transcription-repair coupling factor, partial [uncultured bacterium (gcode 4)]